MSDPVTPLDHARFEGFVTVEEIGPLGMITLRADLSDPATATAVKDVTGGDIPAPGRVETVGDNAIAWMSPDELLLILPLSYVPQALAQLGEKLSGKHHLLADVSHARAVFRVSGTGLRDALAKLTPADLSPEAMTPGTLRRTRLAQVAGAIHLRDETTAEILCFRSVAAYVFGLLRAAARPGSAPGLFDRSHSEQ